MGRWGEPCAKLRNFFSYRIHDKLYLAQGWNCYVRCQKSNGSRSARRFHTTRQQQVVLTLTNETSTLHLCPSKIIARTLRGSDSTRSSICILVWNNCQEATSTRHRTRASRVAWRLVFASEWNIAPIQPGGPRPPRSNSFSELITFISQPSTHIQINS